MEKSMEKCMEIIASAGEGKSLAMAAIQKARAGEYEAAQENLIKADEVITTAHQHHSQLLFDEADGKEVNLSLFMVHAADHLTGADVVKELAEELIYVYKEVRHV